jgi:hypothetical protein
MKKGDLVKHHGIVMGIVLEVRKRSIMRRQSVTGKVVGEKELKPMITILWTDGQTTTWSEPLEWYEVISEAK